MYHTKGYDTSLSLLTLQAKQEPCCGQCTYLAPSAVPSVWPAGGLFDEVPVPLWV